MALPWTGSLRPSSELPCVGSDRPPVASRPAQCGRVAARAACRPGAAPCLGA